MDNERDNPEAHGAVVFGPPPRRQSPTEFGAQSHRPPSPRSHESGTSRVALVVPPPGLETEGPRRTASPTHFTRPTDGEAEYNSPTFLRSTSQRFSEYHPNDLSPASPTRRSREGSRRETGGSEMPRPLDAAVYSQHSRKSNIDWIVPVDPPNGSTQKETHRLRTVEERLEPTLKHAERERTHYAMKSQMTGIALNVAIGLQVLLGSLTTAIAAATSASIGVAVLGGLSTLVASYLARARGSGEPELSNIRVKDLDQFIRECKAFMLDHGHSEGHEHDEQIKGFRQRFEHLLGNGVGSNDPSIGERALQALGLMSRQQNPAIPAIPAHV